MSFSNFMINGLSGQQGIHLRSGYPADVVVANTGRAGFDGEEFWQEDDAGKMVSIDSVVRVNTVSDQVRREERSIWKGHKKDCLILFSVTLIGGVAAAVAAVAASTVFPLMLGVVILASIVSFNLLGISGFTFYRYVQSKDQHNQWKDPLPNLIEERKRVGVEGFGYAFRNQLKGKLVTNAEIQDLWHSQMEKTKLNLLGLIPGLSINHAPIIKEFFCSGLLSDQKLSYAFSEEGIPQNIGFLSERYEALHAQYSQLKSMTEQMQRSIKNQKRESHLANDRQRDLQLAPWIRWFNVNYQQPLEREVVVLQTRSKGAYIFAGPSNDCDSYNDLDPRFSQMQMVFDAMTAPIRELHARNQQQINDWANGELQNIQQNEDGQLGLFFNPIAQLVSQYIREEEEFQVPIAEFGQQPERLYPDLSEDFAPSSPPLEENYQPPGYNPEWNSVVGEVDWENRVLEITTTRRIYH